jgi:aldose 1-epimerase
VAVVTTLGATLLSLKYKNQELTLNWQTLEQLADPTRNPKYGATCGRVAGRISNAAFSLNNETYSLEANNGPNCLHGGSQGFDQQIWEVHPLTDAVGVEFRRTSEDMEMGFPGRIEVSTRYILKDNALIMHWDATTETDILTPINLCNHAYWNLSGDFKESTIANH